MIPVQQTLREGFAAFAPGIKVAFHPPTHSGLLAKQILAGAQADVFISAGWRYVMDLHEAGILPHPEPIAGNALALLVRPNIADQIRDLSDLMRPGVRLLVPPQESDPLGEYIAELIGMAGFDAAVSDKRERGEISEHLPALREGMAGTDIDAAIVYASMLNAFAHVGTQVLLPPSFDLRDRIVFGAGAIELDGHASADADAFVSFLIGVEGQARMVSSGFLPREQAVRNLQANE